MNEKVKQIFLKKFKVLNKLKEDIKQNIRYLYVFKEYYYIKEEKFNIFLVTNDDKVYCFGYNSFGLLGFGYDYDMNEFALNEYLNNKQIDFKNSEFHVISLTSDQGLFLGL